MREIVEKPKPRRDVARQGARRFFTHENALLGGILLILIVVIAVLTKGLSVTRGNITNIWLQSSTRGIASVGQAFVILTGGIDVSVGGIGCLSAVLGAALLTSGHANLIGHPVPLSLGIVIVLLTALSLGAMNGFFVSRVGVPALIATLAMWIITGGATFLTCKGFTLFDLPRTLALFGQGYVAGVPVPVIFFIAVAAVGYFTLYHTPFGRSVYAVGGNPMSAWLSGVKTTKILFIVYLVSGFTAGLSGLVLMARGMSASMSTASGLEFDSITATCLGGISLAGGRGTLIGAMIGVVILGVINNAMNILGLDPALQSIVKGSILVAAVALDVQRRRG